MMQVLFAVQDVPSKVVLSIDQNVLVGVLVGLINLLVAIGNFLLSKFNSRKIKEGMQQHMPIVHEDIAEIKTILSSILVLLGNRRKRHENS